MAQDMFWTIVTIIIALIVLFVLIYGATHVLSPALKGALP